MRIFHIMHQFKSLYLYRTTQFIIMMCLICPMLLLVLYLNTSEYHSYSIEQNDIHVRTLDLSSIQEGFELSYYEKGDPANQTVVFVHGTPGIKGMWLNYLKQMPSNLHYISIDRLGFGDSSPPEAVTQLKLQAASIAVLLKKFASKTQSKPVVIGHSFGGSVVTRLAADFPDLVGAIIVVASSLDGSFSYENMSVKLFNRHRALRYLISRPWRNCIDEMTALEGELKKLEPLIEKIKASVIILQGTNDGLVSLKRIENFQELIRSNPKIDKSKIDIRIIAQQNHFIPWNMNGKEYFIQALQDAILLSK